jgi:hypothetical protein
MPGWVVAVAGDYDWKESEQHFQLFLPAAQSPEETSPSCAYYYLSPFGRIREAVELLEKTVESDPLNVRSRSTLGNLLGSAPEGTTKQLRSIEKRWKSTKACGSRMHHWLGSCVLKGKVVEALAAAGRACQLAPWNAVVTGQLAAMLVRTGDRSRADQLIRQLTGRPNPQGPSSATIIPGSSTARLAKRIRRGSIPTPKPKPHQAGRAVREGSAVGASLFAPSAGPSLAPARLFPNNSRGTA